MTRSTRFSTAAKLARSGLAAALAIGGILVLGARTAAAAPTLSNVNPVADSFTSSSSPNANYGSSSALQTDGQPLLRSYLKFQVPNTGGLITKATLKVYATFGNSAGYDIYRVSVTDWTEGSLTYANQPALGAKVGASGGFQSNAWTSVDVTADVKSSSTYSLALVARDTHHVTYSSREAANNKPVLTVESQPAPTAAPTTTTTPADSGIVRAAFYYPWFTETWGSSANPFSVYHPSQGYYSSDDPAVLANHIAAMRYANLNAAIVSWWGQGQHSEATRIPAVLNASKGTDFKEALYYEKEGSGNPSVTEISADLQYIQGHYAGHSNYLTRRRQPVVMAFGDGTDNCDMATRWKHANAGRFFVVLKVFGGYRNCADQPDGWHQYAPAVAQDLTGWLRLLDLARILVEGREGAPPGT